MASLVDFVAFVDLADDAFLVDVESRARWTDATTEVVDDLVWRARGLTFVALNGCVALISWQALADHRTDGQRVENLTDRVDAARFSSVTWVDAFAGDASRLRLAVAITMTSFVVDLAAVLRWICSRRARALRSVVVDVADLVDVTAGCLLARILALVVDASLVQRTLRVTSASEQHASDLRVATEALRTVADGAVVDSGAFSVGAALVGRANGHTLTIHASVVARALVIRGAADLGASNLWISLEALLARAHWFVALDAAERVRSAVTWIAADAIDARFLRLAVRVSDATNHSDGLDGLACATAAADVAFRADADHGADWSRWNHLTLRWLTARCELKTWIFAFAVDTGESRGAVGVVDALESHFWFAVNVGISNESWRTLADGHVVVSHAFRPR